jgi:hypothetical protein
LTQAIAARPAVIAMVTGSVGMTESIYPPPLCQPARGCLQPRKTIYRRGR